MKLDKIIKVLAVILIMILTANVFYFVGRGNKVYVKLPTVKIEKYVEEKPTYDYLCSVTVFIEGKTFNSEKNSFDSLYIGTGIVIAETKYYTYILTNTHVAEDYTDTKEKVYLFIKDNNIETDVPATIVKKLSVLDIAVLRVRGKLVNKRPIKGFAEPKIGEKTYMVGHHLGMKYIYGEGVISGYDNISLVAQLPVMWGNSGSGIFNKKGEMVGIIHSLPYTIVDFFPVFDVAHGFATDSEYIITFLRTIPELKNLSILNEEKL